MSGHENSTNISYVKIINFNIITFADCPMLRKSKLQTETYLSNM